MPRAWVTGFLLLKAQSLFDVFLLEDPAALEELFEC